MTFTERVAAYFKERPNQWIDGNTLAEVGGCYAWRSRISDCRTQFRMAIENRQRRAKGQLGRVYTISEYRFIPAKEQAA